jgi:hypothetical protein
VREHCIIETTASDFDDAQQSWSDYSNYDPDLSLYKGNLHFDGLGEDYKDGLLVGSGQSKDRLVFPRPVQNPILVSVQTSPVDVPNPPMGPELDYWSNDHERALSYILVVLMKAVHLQELPTEIMGTPADPMQRMSSAVPTAWLPSPELM